MGWTFKVGVRSALNNWRYNFAVALTVLVGLVSICLFEGYMREVTNMYVDHFSGRYMFGDILIEHRDATRHVGFDAMLDPGDVQKIEQVLAQSNFVRTRNRFLAVSGKVNVGGREGVFSGYGYDISEGESLRGMKWKWNAVAGFPLDSSTAGQVVLGRSLAEQLGCKLPKMADYLQRRGQNRPAYHPTIRPFDCSGQNVVTLASTTERGSVRSSEFQLQGIVDAGFKDVDLGWLMIPLDDARKLTGSEKLSFIGVAVRDSLDPESVASQLNDQLTKSGIPAVATTWQAHRFSDLYVRTMDLLGVFDVFFLSIILVISGISVFNLLVKAIHERRREIGLFRSLGFRASHIYRMFLVETATVSGIGIAFGITTTLIIAPIVNYMGILYKAGILTEPVPFVVGTSATLFLSVSAFLLIIAFAATILAVWVNSRGGIAGTIQS